jgi:hypothetical protein
MKDSISRLRLILLKMRASSSPPPFTPASIFPWRRRAALLVEELFPATLSHHWDLLLDLRAALLSGANWEETIQIFQQARTLLETDHYLPFFRLRRLLNSHLKLADTEVSATPCLVQNQAKSTRMREKSPVPGAGKLSGGSPQINELPA